MNQNEEDNDIRRKFARGNKSVVQGSSENSRSDRSEKEVGRGTKINDVSGTSRSRAKNEGTSESNMSLLIFKNIDEAIGNRAFYGQGTEAKCYIDNNEAETIRKIITWEAQYDTEMEFLNSKKLYNKYFPATAYREIGKIENKNLIVYDQEFLFNAKELALEELPNYSSQQKIREYAKEKKKQFERTKNDLTKKGWKYLKNGVFEKDGVIMSDVHLKNVMEKDGELYYIDVAFQYKDRDIAKRALKEKIL